MIHAVWNVVTHRNTFSNTQHISNKTFVSQHTSNKILQSIDLIPQKARLEARRYLDQEKND